MSLFNSTDPIVASAQANVMSTLRAGTREEMAEAQALLTAAVQAKTKRDAKAHQMERMRAAVGRGTMTGVFRRGSSGMAVAA